ncbi:MAG: hypothetical protein P4L16_05315 [Chlamydiales bacterium]|nr:hypothetical protein [Chlamydiales bacterium]
MKKLVYFCIILAGLVAVGQVDAQYAKPDTLIKGIGNLNHPVSTTSVEAQAFFNQGLTLVYAFNHESAYISFETAAKLDPKLAMAYWGMALSLGPNINTPIDLEREKKAYELIQKALSLSNNDKVITANEKEYIQALAARYTDNPNPDYKALDIAYNNAMYVLMQNYPEDLDAAALYAESGMDLHPWALWTGDGKSVEGTDALIAVLESIIKRDPMHIGANHYYIHAVEGSDRPERALLSAERLPDLVPASGHLIHMPSHIYILVGDYHKAFVINEDAVRVDEEFVRANGVKEYILHYTSHNIYFASRAACLEGNYARAKKYADKLSEFLKPEIIASMPDMEYYTTGSLLIDLRFNKWNKILTEKEPPVMVKNQVPLWFFARSVCLVKTNDLSGAKKAREQFLLEKQKARADARFGYNKLSSILDIAEHYLNACIARAEGKINDAIDHLKMAIGLQDSLGYNEPPDWFFPIRETLGATYFLNQQYEEAAKVFKEDLNRHPRNGRSLFGLLQTLKAQNKTTDAFWVGEEFKKAWKYADTDLKMENL